MHPPHKIIKTDATADTLNAQPQCKSDGSAAGLDVPIDLEAKVYGRGLPPQRPCLERNLNPSCQSLTRVTSTIETAHKKVEKIACLGSGFVGGPTSAVMAFKTDVQVTVVDINQNRIAAWNSNVLPIYEPGLLNVVRVVRDGVVSFKKDHQIQSKQRNTIDGPPGDQKWDRNPEHRHPNLFFSTDIKMAIQDADLIFICVNTPTKIAGIGKGAVADLGFVEAATRQIAKFATGNKIVVEKSTVPCRTAQMIREILTANARPDVHFDILSNPEFLAEGTAVRNLLYPDRIIIGSMSTIAGYRAATSLAEVYAQWVPRERIITMNLWSSELTKLAANALLAQRISSVNALSALCEATGADVNEVSYACGLDSRIGHGMLKAGPGFGGSCFQKDLLNIVYLSESLHLYEVASYWRAIIDLNEYQKHRFTQRIISCMSNSLDGRKIAVLGFAFKKNTSDTRESPAITLVSSFVAEGAHVAIYDPKVQEEQIWLDLADDGGDMDNLGRQVEVCHSAYAACLAADAVVVATEWDEFSNKIHHRVPVVEEVSKVLAEIDPNRVLTPRGKHSFQSNSRILAADDAGTKRDYNGTIASNLGEGACIRTALDDESIHRLDWAHVAEGMRKPMFVFDGHNILDAQKLEALGFRVEAIGKPSKATFYTEDND